MTSRFLKAASVLVVLGVALCGQAFSMPSDAESNTTQLTKLFPEGMGLGAVGLPLTLGFGATGDYVEDRNLDDSTDLSGAWYGGNVYWDPLENVHLSAFLGGARLKLGNVPIQGRNSASTKVGLDTDTGFAGGGSGKIDITEFSIFPDAPKMKLFGAGGYRHAILDVEEMHASFDARTLDLDVEVSEWQGTLGVSQRWDNPLAWLGLDIQFSLVPYVGVQYNDLDLNISGVSAFPTSPALYTENVKTGHRNSKDSVAVVAGAQILSFNNVVSLSVEGRFIAETAVSVNGHVRW